METKPIAQSPFQKKNHKSSESLTKNRYQSLLVLSNFDFFHFIPNIFSWKVYIYYSGMPIKFLYITCETLLRSSMF